MKFHYEFDIKKLPLPISHRHHTLLIGSCFTENIGEKLQKHGFRVLENPNGILFNPISVTDAITQYIENTTFTPSTIFQYNEAWHSWKHHSRFSGLNEGACLDKINKSTQQAHEYLKKTDHLLITLGSAWVYQLTEKAMGNMQGKVAANNHKAPSDWFTKKLLKVEETMGVLDNMVHRLFHINPNIQLIFTISPVRHLREGVIENNRSKAVLIQAVHQLVEKFDRLYYFPAYELVIDDLRDYRFYAEDLVHPNYHATQYVWEKFTEACMEEDTRLLMKEIAAINLACQHKPFNPASQQHQQFLHTYFEKANYLQHMHPYIDLSDQISFLRNSRAENG